MKIRLQKFSPILNSVGAAYRGLTKFTLVDQYFNFSWGQYDSGFTNVEFYVFSSVPTL
jgi:hypothetical protein